jgi:hypothetical protein
MKCRQVKSFGLKCSWVKCSEVLSIRVYNIIIRYIGHMKFAAYMAFSFITFLHVLLVPFFYHCIYGFMCCMFSFNFVSYDFYSYIHVFVLLCMFFSLYCISLCVFMNCLNVNVYCTTATGCQPNCS